MQFAVQTTRAGDVATAAVYGELDIATTPELTRAVRGLLDSQPRAAVIDLSPTLFLDSTACRYLLNLRRLCAEAGVELTVVCPEDAWDAWRVLELLGLLDALNVVDALPPGAPVPPPPAEG